MRYFNLSKEDITFMKDLTKRKLTPYLLTFLFTALIIITFYAQILKKSNTIIVSSNLFLIEAIGITLLLFIIHFIFSSGLIQALFKKNQKMVYSGFLTQKKIKEKANFMRYVFYMDGMKFSVNESVFQSFNPGDAIEFHVSLKSKRLIKISKPSAEFNFR